jgi:A/G-specific adenine glycosylase
VKKTLHREDPRVWYYALMDYGVFIKKHLPNPGRKSANHMVQSKFEGSRRQVRGRIIKALTKTNPISRQALKKSLRISDKLLSEILKQLEKEGLIAANKETISFP